MTAPEPRDEFVLALLADRDRLIGLEVELAEAREALAESKAIQEQQHEEFLKVLESPSWRLGRALTGIPRALRSLLGS